ncbi:cyanophycin synthetase [Chryseobacterium sp.]|uniref:cyanophycin synthetase n=1 Tax=Chryseobacterium sp. TaxID=1871047 RepID=UPI0012A88FA8|nr:cyanophycin synthetase [Chryseobacterium sp.]QFG53514.1 cyanophycin synthetase [Chryseobacterium sp.]
MNITTNSLPENTEDLSSGVYRSTANSELNHYQQGSTLARLRNTDGLGPSTLSIIREAEKRGIPWRRMDGCSKIMLGYGKNQQNIRATITGKTSCIGVELADNKQETKNVLQQAGIPVPEGYVCSEEGELLNALSELQFPLVIKPLIANHGRGVSVNITNEVNALQAFRNALKICSRVIVERYIRGHDHRLLLVNGKLIAAAHRIPAHIVGDGKSTVHQLLTKLNGNPERGEGHEAVLTKISVNCDTENLLKQQGYGFDAVVPGGQTVFLKSTANLSTGGIAADVTDEVHAENRFLAERVAALMDLDICGIDVIAPSLAVPLSKNGGAVIEVNAAPGFRMHLAPSIGEPRNVAAAAVDMLFPPGSESRIPILAVTGTNGKTTTARLLAHIAQNAGYNPGFTTTDGVYISGFKIISGDCSGPSSASTVLADPLVDFAVLETARGGILRSGLAFESCDVAVLTNIAADHLGLKNINTLEELAEVKATLLRSVKKSGWAVLNADDEHCIRIAATLDCNIAYFAMDNSGEILQNHISEGGLAITVVDHNVIIYHNCQAETLLNLDHIPLTMQGKVRCMTANVLAAVAAAFAYGISSEHLRASLKSFRPGPELTPGRMNLFELNRFKVLVDYAHNPHGMMELQHYLSQVSARQKVGIIAGVGDRRDCDIIELAGIAAHCFDHIIIRQDDNLRGRTLDEMNRLMIQGITESGAEVSYELIRDEKEAIRQAMARAKKDDFIVALCDDYPAVTEIIRAHQN